MGTCRIDGEVTPIDAAPDSHPIEMPIDAAIDSAPPLPCTIDGLTCPGATPTVFMCGTTCVAKCQSAQTFASAESFCAGWQGHLAKVPDDATNACIAPHVGQASWLGLTQAANQPTPGDGWTWTDTSPLTYTRWAAGKPDDGGGGENNAENCAHIEPGGVWDDESCGNQRFFYCSR